MSVSPIGALAIVLLVLSVPQVITGRSLARRGQARSSEQVARARLSAGGITLAALGMLLVTVVPTVPAAPLVGLLLLAAGAILWMTGLVQQLRGR